MAKTTTKTAGTKKSTIDRLGGQNVIVLLVVIALFIFFCIMSPNFRKYTTIVNILDFSYYISLMAIGVAFTLMTGGVDLSIGTGLICYSLVGGYLIVHQGLPTGVGILISILMGMAVGVVNGFLVAIMELPAFLATLCTCMILEDLDLSFQVDLEFHGRQLEQQADGSEKSSRFRLVEQIFQSDSYGLSC